MASPHPQGSIFQIDPNVTFDNGDQTSHNASMSTTVINLSPQELREMIESAVERVIERKLQATEQIREQHVSAAPVESNNKLANLVYRPDAIKGDPDDLVHIEWEYNIDLP